MRRSRYYLALGSSVAALGLLPGAALGNDGDRDKNPHDHCDRDRDWYRDQGWDKDRYCDKDKDKHHGDKDRDKNHGGKDKNKNKNHHGGKYGNGKDGKGKRGGKGDPH